MWKFAFTAIVIFFFHPASAQFATVSGRVLSKSTQEPLPGVTVILKNSSQGTTTDVDGNFSLQLTVGRHALLFRQIGMREQEQEIELAENENKILIILLENESKELGVVVVSASKFEQKLEDVTVSMNVIKPSLIEARNTTSLDEIIDQSASVNIIDGQANIRGGSGWSYGAGSRVLVLVDDLPLLSADASDTKWEFLPVENVEQIEVIKGAASALYGSSALNGVINIRTAYPKETPQTKVNLYSGVYDPHPKLTLDGVKYDLSWAGKRLQHISGTNFLHSRRIGNFDLVLGGNGFLDDGYREGEFTQRARVTLGTRYRFKKIDGLSCGVNLNTMYKEGSSMDIWQDDTTGAFRPQGGLDTATTILREDAINRTNVDPFITYADKRGNTHKIRTRYFRTNNRNNTDQQSKADLYYGEYQYHRRFRQWLDVTAGLAGSFSKVKSQLYNDHDGSNYAEYVQLDAGFNRWKFSAGARLEKNRVDTIEDDFTPVWRAGINYMLMKATHVRASYGQGYRYPSIAEKFINTTVGGAKIYPNDSLQSETGYSAEIGLMQGLKLGRWTGYIDLAGFYTEYEKMVEFTFSQWEPNSFVPGFKGLNVGRTRISGLDVALAGEGDIGPIFVSVNAGYTYMQPKVIEYDSAYIKALHVLDPPGEYGAYLGSDSSDFLKYRYEHLLKADLEVRYRKVSLGMSVRYNSYMKNIDKMFVEYPFSDIVAPGVSHYRDHHRKGDTVYDARLSLQCTEQVKIAVVVKNVFNYIYMQRPADMQPPRTFTLQATLTF